MFAKETTEQPNQKSNEDWIKQLKPFWKEFRKLQTEFNKTVMSLELKMKNEIGDSDIEFAFADGECFGIGFGSFNEKNKTIGLFHDTYLEGEYSP